MKKNNKQVFWYAVTLFSIFTGTANAQKHDFNWVMGMHEFAGTSGYNNAILHFTPNGIQVEEMDLKMNFESTATAMSDSTGQLLFCIFRWKLYHPFRWKLYHPFRWKLYHPFRWKLYHS
jgi:hypothetical protein